MKAMILPLLLFVLFGSTVWSINTLDQIKSTLLNQLSQTGMVDLALTHLTIQLRNEQHNLQTSILEYCSIEVDDINCDNKSLEVQTAEQSIIIRRMISGFIDADDPSSGIEEGIRQTFSNNLCLVIEFKNNNEFTGISPMLADKTVLFCAKSSNLSQSLLEKKQVASDDEADLDISQNPTDAHTSGWRCYNKSSFTSNGGLAMGETVIDNKTYGFLSDAISPWYMCAQQSEDTT